MKEWTKKVKSFALPLLLLCCLVALPSLVYAGISDQEAKVFLARATFGPTPESIQRLKTLGDEGWLDQQLVTVSQCLVDRSVQTAPTAPIEDDLKKSPQCPLSL